VFLAFIELEILGRQQAVGEGDREGVQAWLPPHGPSCLSGALGPRPRVTMCSVSRAACSVRKCPRTDTTLAEPLREDHPRSIRVLALFGGSDAYQRTLGGLGYSVRTGRPAFEHVYGKPFFDYLAEEPDLAQIFNDAMTGSVVGEGAAIAAGHEFSLYRTIVDVGGGHGALLAQILDRHAGPVGVLFDAPKVISSAHGSISELVAHGRLQTVPGDFFDAVPAGADAYLLKSIIHDWDDERAVAILKNCRAAMAADERVLLVELIVAEGNVESPAKHRDFAMLVFVHGRERTEGEYRDLLDRAGLRLTQTTPTDSGLSII
jgi:hypothetical protein